MQKSISLTSALIICFCSLLAGQEDAEKSNGLKIEILAVKQDKIGGNDELIFPDAFAKWSITTKVKNVSNKVKIILLSPAFGGSLDGKIDRGTFVPSSGYLHSDKIRDFIRIQPKGEILSNHKVFLGHGVKNSEFVLEGFFAGHLNPERIVEYPRRWKLAGSSSNLDFSFSIFLCDRHSGWDKEVLEDEYDNFWRGEVISPPIKLSLPKPVQRN